MVAEKDSIVLTSTRSLKASCPMSFGYAPFTNSFFTEKVLVFESRTANRELRIASIEKSTKLSSLPPPQAAHHSPVSSTFAAWDEY
jgi:hypothetical protein